MATPTSDPAIDAETKMPEILGFLISGTILSTVAVVLRIITRAGILKRFGADDWTMVFTQVLNIGTAVAIGLGERHAELLPQVLTNSLQRRDGVWGATYGPCLVGKSSCISRYVCLIERTQRRTTPRKPTQLTEPRPSTRACSLITPV